MSEGQPYLSYSSPKLFPVTQGPGFSEQTIMIETTEPPAQPLSDERSDRSLFQFDDSKLQTEHQTSLLSSEENPATSFQSLSDLEREREKQELSRRKKESPRTRVYTESLLPPQTTEELGESSTQTLHQPLLQPQEGEERKICCVHTSRPKWQIYCFIFVILFITLCGSGFGTYFLVLDIMCNNASTQKIITNSFSSIDVRHVEISTNTGNIKLVESSSLNENFRLDFTLNSYSESNIENHLPTISFNRTHLRVHSDIDSSFLTCVGLVITLHLSSNSKDLSIHLKSTSGQIDVSLSESIVPKELNIETDSGMILIQNVNADDINLKSDSGQINCQIEHPSNVTVSTGSSTIDIIVPQSGKSPFFGSFELFSPNDICSVTGTEAHLTSNTNHSKTGWINKDSKKNLISCISLNSRCFLASN
eukprot:c19707_g1_i3.p1 GENE.c19707_g1_i3~~c19707_g1_i3.p1  ORF type:complete len:421 (-),score=158.19 c19707_g1_i3:28-1290(-)